jgi:hypothetical protein
VLRLLVRMHLLRLLLRLHLLHLLLQHLQLLDLRLQRQLARRDRWRRTAQGALLLLLLLLLRLQLRLLRLQLRLLRLQLRLLLLLLLLLLLQRDLLALVLVLSHHLLHHHHLQHLLLLRAAAACGRQRLRWLELHRRQRRRRHLRRPVERGNEARAKLRRRRGAVGVRERFHDASSGARSATKVYGFFFVF